MLISEIASDTFRFSAPLSFGTAKVATFFYFANFIFYFFVRLFFAALTPFLSLVCGLQRCDFFSYVSSIILLVFHFILIFANHSKNNAFFQSGHKCTQILVSCKKNFALVKTIDVTACKLPPILPIFF